MLIDPPVIACRKSVSPLLLVQPCFTKLLTMYWNMQHIKLNTSLWINTFWVQRTRRTNSLSWVAYHKNAFRSLLLSYQHQSFLWYDIDYRFVICIFHRLQWNLLLWTPHLCGHPALVDTFLGPVEFSLYTWNFWLETFQNSRESHYCGHLANMDTFCPALRCPHQWGSTVYWKVYIVVIPKILQPTNPSFVMTTTKILKDAFCGTRLIID